jgi:serine/threonine protein kinase/tetratricopeptide (TPR) repeat protein
MTPERWQEVRELLEGAMHLEPPQRLAYLERHCSDDPSLLRDVDSILAVEHELRASFLESPAIAHLTPDQNTAASISWTPGTKFGPYEIQSLLGAGGMGEVYRARDTRLDRTVALKVLPVLQSSDPARKQRFEREARAIAALQHPNICTLHDVGQEGGVDYLVMEYLEGETLAERMTKGPLPLDQILRFGVEITDALEAAHRRGIVHRDLKPGNIFLTTHGECKVLDFGLAKLDESHGEQETLTTLPATEASKNTLTAPGLVIGTVAYMSPEQAGTKELDARTDLFSFGAVLYEMATGQVPFRGESNAAILDAILTRTPVTPLHLNPDLPPELERIIDQALKKDRTLRYQHALDIRSDLHTLMSHTEFARLLTAGKGGAAQNIGKRWKLILPVAFALSAVVLGSYFYLRRPPRLTERDTVVLADFANRTGDPVFDDTLKTALDVSLRQSPFLSVLSDNKVATTLKMMARPADTRLTPDVAREVCQRTGSKAYIAGSISSLGDEYVLALKTVNCETGDTLAQDQVRAPSQGKVLDELGRAASNLRGELGESLITVQKLDVPLAQATTSSLEALKAYSLGSKIWAAQGENAAFPFFQRAVELDPKFAMAYARIGVMHGNLFQLDLSTENTRKAYELRMNTSERERLYIESYYYAYVTGETEKSTQVLENLAQLYPRDFGPHNNLANNYGYFGKHEKSLEQALIAMQLDPTVEDNYITLGNSYICLNRLNEAKEVAKLAEERKLESEGLIVQRYQVAFLEGNEEQMRRLEAPEGVAPGAQTLLLHEKEAAEAYRGRLRKAREMVHASMNPARSDESLTVPAFHQAGLGLLEAYFGEAQRGRADAKEAVPRAATGDFPQWASALALAVAGDSKGAATLLDGLEKSVPLDTNFQHYWAPSVRAAIAMDNENPKKALELLLVTSPYELGTMGNMDPIYLRGNAYLKLGDGRAAAAEFQKIIEHPGIARTWPVGALAHLGLARAYRLQGDTNRARIAYQDFLTLWNDADPDIPALKQAKAEYARLK